MAVQMLLQSWLVDELAYVEGRASFISCLSSVLSERGGGCWEVRAKLFERRSYDEYGILSN